MSFYTSSFIGHRALCQVTDVFGFRSPLFDLPGQGVRNKEVTMTMRAFVVLIGATLSITGMCLGFQKEPAAPPKPATQKKLAPAATAKPAKPADTEPKPVDKPASVDAKPTAADAGPARHVPVPEKYAADEKAIRKLNHDLVAAYSADDAKQVAALFSPDAEYVSAQGGVFHGHKEIEASLADFVSHHPGCKLESDIEDLRFVSDAVALGDGWTTVTHKEDSDPTHCHFTAVYVKVDGKWQVASIRDRSAAAHSSHEDQLARLEFLIGDWVDEEDHSVVSFTCKPVDNGKFLIRDFTLKIAGQEMLRGTQRIGWDPLNSRLRAWIFDSEGGFADGIWQQRGDEWVLHCTGVTADGQTASGSTIYKMVDDHTVTWQAVDHEIGGVPLPDSPVFTLTHRAPEPGVPEEALTQKNDPKNPKN